jgi:hypothetical protein
MLVFAALKMLLGRHFYEAILGGICREINDLAPQWGLPPIQLVHISPTFIRGKCFYKQSVHIEGIKDPFNLYWQAQDFDNEFRMRQKIWCTYLKVVLRWRRNAFLHMNDWCGYHWYIEIEFPETRTALELEFYGEQRDESRLVLSAINRALLAIKEVTLAEGKWDDLLPQFLHWYCVFLKSDYDELRRAAGLMLL